MTPNQANKLNLRDMLEDKAKVEALLAIHPGNTTLKGWLKGLVKYTKRCSDALAEAKAVGYSDEYDKLWKIIKYGSKPLGQEQFKKKVALDNDPLVILKCAEIYVADIKRQDISKLAIERWIERERWREYEDQINYNKDTPRAKIWCIVCKAEATTHISIKMKHPQYKERPATWVSQPVCDECKQYDNMTQEQIREMRTTR